jgi:DNA adenine methylase
MVPPFSCVRPSFAWRAAVVNRGSSILSVNDVPELREVFARFAIESVTTRYTISGGKWSEVAEIIVTGPGRGFAPSVPDLLASL